MGLSRLKKKFGVSSHLSQSGVWINVDLGDGGAPVGFLLAMMGRSNRKWSSLASESWRKDKTKHDAGLVSTDDSVKRAMRVFCTTVLLDWRGIEDDNGKPIPYSVEQGMQVLQDMDGLYDYLLDESQALSNFQDQSQQELVGN